MKELKGLLHTDLMQAMRAQNEIAREVTRSLIAAFDNERIAKGRDLTNDECVAVFKRAHKQRVEAAEQYRKIGANGHAEKEEAEAKIILAYLPQMIQPEEYEPYITKMILEAPEGTQITNMLMGHLKQKWGARIDMRAARAYIDSLKA